MFQIVAASRWPLTLLLGLLLAMGSSILPAGAAPTSNVVVLDQAAPWRFHNQGQDLGTNWRSPNYDASQWAAGSGHFGVGEPGAATDLGAAQPTTYFRSDFHIVEAASVLGLQLSLRRDDGAVIYLNGSEVHRSNMPAGTISFDTRAQSIDNWDGRKVEVVELPVSALVSGRNVLAVEVHQAGHPGWFSGDLTFEATLSVAQSASLSTAPSKPQAVTASAGDGSAQISWQAPANLGGEQIQKYTATASPGGAACVTANLSCVITGLTNGTTYTVSVTASTAAGSSPATDGVSVTPGIPVPAGWVYTGGDEFNGTKLDQSKWLAYDVSNYLSRYGNADPYFLPCLSDDNVVVRNGAATLQAKKQSVTCQGYQSNYTSAFLGSGEVGTYYPLYGRFEMRARIPHGQGIWPAFWLRHINGSSSAEVDVVEVFHAADPGSVLQTLHFPKTVGYNVTKTGVNFESAVKGTGGWHTFAVDIEQVYPNRHDAVKFTFWVDNLKTLEYVNTNATQWTSLPDRNKAWNIAINTAVGGEWAGHPDQKLGWFPVRGGRCSLERPQRTTSDAAGCDDERTAGRWYSPQIPKAPSQDGKPDIWLAPWNYGQPSADYVIDYFRHYRKA